MKDKKLLLGIIVAFVFLFSVGMTYAYFSVTANIVGEPNDILTSTANLSLVYTDADHNVVLNGAMPGDSVEKVFTVENDGTLPVSYNVKWKTLHNEIINDELEIELDCTSYSTYLGEGNANNVQTGTCGYNFDTVGTTTDGSLATMVNIQVGEIQVYTVTITFIDTGEVQNYNQGKSFNGEIMIIDGVYQANVTGYLYNNGGNPIANATITTHSNPLTAVTDENGKYTLYGLEYGEHEIEVRDSSNNIIATDTFTFQRDFGNTSVENLKTVKWNDTE